MGLFKSKKAQSRNTSPGIPGVDGTSNLSTDIFDPPVKWHRQRYKKFLNRISDGYRHIERQEIVEVEMNDPEANLIGSRIENTSLHVPTIDIDFPCELIKSATEDHYHLLINKAMSWGEYKKLLTVMVEVGLIDKGWYDGAVAANSSMVRLPGVLKYEVEQYQKGLKDVLRVLEETQS